MAAKTESRDDSRERLLDAGANLFATKGYAGTSVREICAQADTGNNMVHHYFGSKRGLFEAIVAQFSASVFDTPLRIIEKDVRSREEFVSRFEMFVEETLEALLNNRLPFVMFMREEDAGGWPFEDYFNGFVSFIQRAREKGFVQAGVDAEMLSGMVIDRLGSQVIYAGWIKRTSDQDIEGDPDYKQRWLRANIDLWLHGIVA